MVVSRCLFVKYTLHADILKGIWNIANVHKEINEAHELKKKRSTRERKLGICEIKENMTSTAVNYSVLISRYIHRRKYLVNLRVAPHKKAWRTKQTLTVE